MSKQTDKSLFILSPLTSKSAGFYQEILRGLDTYEQLGNRLIKLTEQAHAFRQFDRVKELAQILVNLPIKNYQAIGYYYLAVAFNNCGKGELDKARRLFELAADIAPPKYQAKAILSLAAVSAHQKDPDAELYYFAETLKASGDIATRLTALRGIAVHKAREGYHAKALKELEEALPLIKYAPPDVYFSHLNAVAVELDEAGRLQEAENVSSITIASPFSPYYPEWQSTFSEIRSKRKSRSTVAISLPQQQPKLEPQPEPKSKSEPQQTAGIVSFPPLKEAPPPKKPERLSPRELGELTASEKRELILTAIRSNTLRESQYDKLIDMVGLLNLGPADKVLDLEDDALLDDIIIIWANNIDPEELAAVMSALRDCSDDLRRNNIIDRIIRIAFEQTRFCTVTEQEWRRKVERRLPKT